MLAAWRILPDSTAIAESTAPDAVIQAAMQGLKPFLDKIPQEARAQFGFDPADSFNAAVLGAPVLVHTITPAALEQYQAGTAVTSLLTPTTLWYFPVRIAGQAKAILVVDRLQDQWQAVSLGYFGLAREWDAIVKQWPESQGFHPELIAIFQAQQHAFTVPKKGVDNLTLLTSGPMETGKAQAAGAQPPYATLGDATTVIQNLIPAVENNLLEPTPE